MLTTYFKPSLIYYLSFYFHFYKEFKGPYIFTQITLKFYIAYFWSIFLLKSTTFALETFQTP